MDLSNLLFKKLRTPIVFIATALLTVLGLFLSLGLRFEFNWEEVVAHGRTGLPLVGLILVRFLGYSYWKLIRHHWRYFATPDLISLIKAHTASSFAWGTFIYISGQESFPRSVLFIEFLVSLGLACGSRFVTRLLSERYIRGSALSNSLARDVIVLGAGDSGHLLVKQLLSLKRLSYRPIAVLDDSERLQGSSVHGVSVVGPIGMLEGIIKEMPSISAVICAIPSLSTSRLKSIESICKQNDIPLKRLQSFEDIACLDADTLVRPLSIESVLQKEVSFEHESDIKEKLNGKTILITGAGGSIGSEIVRQLLLFNPKNLVLLDNSEYNLFSIEREIKEQTPTSNISAVIASVRDQSRLTQVFDTYKPNFVFHAAALKHVPLMESNPLEAFKTNILGTRNVLFAASQCSTEKFVLISTDKAVDPESVMGATKRICEFLVQEFVAKSDLKASIVRFGNVINSTGSVIPTFKSQIIAGGPLTVTHPDMERYFMSISEAVRLVLTSGSLAEEGGLYVLDMGRKVKILDLARKMRALYGRRDIPIVFTGLRPGERLTEMLTAPGEITIPTRFSRVRKIQNSKLTPSNVWAWVMSVEESLPNQSDSSIKDLIFEFAQFSTKQQPHSISAI